MTPGTKPKPSQLKILEGNPGRRPIPESVRVDPQAPKCPAWLDVEAKREWRRIVPELVALGIVGQVDRAALAGYCQAYARWVEAERVLSTEGQYIEGTKGGMIKHPAFQVARDNLTLVKQFCAEFGMTPSSRTRLHATPKQEADPFESFLSQRAN
jgi:P27 family predicted phage terminase small subunit